MGGFYSGPISILCNSAVGYFDGMFAKNNKISIVVDWQ